jgi:hypothetical protein
MILINGIELNNVLVEEWKNLYNKWVDSLSITTLLKWVSDNYNLFEENNIKILYWFIGKDNFCELYYKGIIIIVDNVNVNINNFMIWI